MSMEEENSTIGNNPDQSIQEDRQTIILKQKGYLLPILGILVVLLIVGGAYYFYTQKTSQSLIPQSSVNTQTQTTPANKSVNLNPNTGNLYSDIKVRLNQVIK